MPQRSPAHHTPSLPPLPSPPPALPPPTSQSKRASGTVTRALLGSMVQKGKFSAGMDSLVIVLNIVDLPTLGSPTIPICTGRARRAGQGRQAGRQEGGR